MDISVEILATSVPISKQNLHYKVKTWWAHVDVEEDVTSIRLPSLPMIQSFYNLNGRETTVFVEMWYSNLDLFPAGAMRFLGLVKQRVDNQLRNPVWNPTVEWLEVYDPIEDICRGRLLLKIDAKFVPSALPLPQSPNPSGNQQLQSNSSYFNNSISESVSSSQNNKRNLVENEDNAKDKYSQPIQISTSSSTTKFKSVPVQTEDEILKPEFPSSNINTFFKETPNDAIDLEIAKAKLNLAVKDRERTRKLFEVEGGEHSDFHAPLGVQLDRKTSKLISVVKYRSLPDFGDLSPVQSSTPSRRCRYKTKDAAVRTRINDDTADSEVDDVIQLLNNEIKIKPLKSPLNVESEIHANAKDFQNLYVQEMGDRIKRLNHNVDELEKIKLDMNHLKSIDQKMLESKYSTKKNNLKNQPSNQDGGDLTVYGISTALNYTYGQEMRNEIGTRNTNSQQHNTNPSSRSHPPISRKCAAQFGPSDL